MAFDLLWWAFLFVNSGLTLTAIHIVNILGIPNVEWITSTMTVMLFTGWLLRGTCHAGSDAQIEQEQMMVPDSGMSTEMIPLVENHCSHRDAPWAG